MGQFYGAAGSGPIPAAPAANTSPTVSGTATLASTLTATPGVATGWPKPVSTYQWIRDASTVIAGATGLTRVVAAADQTHTLKFQQTDTNDLGSVVQTSTATGTIP